MFKKVQYKCTTILIDSCFEIVWCALNFEKQTIKKKPHYKCNVTGICTISVK